MSEDLLGILVVAGIYHLACAIVAGVHGEGRTIGFGPSFLLYFFCPLVWLGRFIVSKDKRDLSK